MLRVFGRLPFTDSARRSTKILYNGKALVLYAEEAKQYVSLPVTGPIRSI
jgi:hypothetical protein